MIPHITIQCNNMKNIITATRTLIIFSLVFSTYKEKVRTTPIINKIIIEKEKNRAGKARAPTSICNMQFLQLHSTYKH